MRIETFINVHSVILFLVEQLGVVLVDWDVFQVIIFHVTVFFAQHLLVAKVFSSFVKHLLLCSKHGIQVTLFVAATLSVERVRKEILEKALLDRLIVLRFHRGFAEMLLAIFQKLLLVFIDFCQLLFSRSVSMNGSEIDVF